MKSLYLELNQIQNISKLSYKKIVSLLKIKFHEISHFKVLDNSYISDKM